MVPLTRQKGLGRSFSVSNTPPPPPPPHVHAGLRTKLRKLSLGARSVFCIRKQNSVGDDGNDGSKEVLHTRTRSDLPWTSSPRVHCPAPPKSTPPLKLKRAQRRTCTTEKANGNEATEAANKLTTKSTEHTTHSQAAASLNSPFINAKDAHGPGDATPLCDHASSLLYFDGSEEERHTVATTGDTISALIDAMFQIGDWDTMLGPGPPTPFTFTDDAGSEKTVKQEEEGRVRKERGCAWRCCGAEEDADVTTDARRAWEAMKRRVLHIEEHGALPEDWEDNEAAAAAASWGIYRDAEAELASREQRARQRKGWAKDALTHRHAGQQQSRPRQASSKKGPKVITTTTTTTAAKAKKGRRLGGCWIREKDGVFVRLVRS